MSRKIVVLNGSPRAKGNTSALVDEFAKGAREVGCDVEIFFLDRMNIHGCKGCFGGGKNFEHPCVQRDDMEKIYPAYRAADVVVLATPLYYWNFSGQLRTAFDRLFAVAECDPNYRNPKKESVLLMAAEGYGFDDLGWIERGHVLAGRRHESRRHQRSQGTCGGLRTRQDCRAGQRSLKRSCGDIRAI